MLTNGWRQVDRRLGKVFNSIESSPLLVRYGHPQNSANISRLSEDGGRDNTIDVAFGYRADACLICVEIRCILQLGEIANDLNRLAITFYSNECQVLASRSVSGYSS